MKFHPTALDCLIIGGGPAGLTAATYLGRFRRTAVLVDAMSSRAAWIPKTHNLIGYTEGISGPILLEKMRSQAELYGAEWITGEVLALFRGIDGTFSGLVEGRTITARRVLLATGGLDVEPELPGIRDAVRSGLVRYCPVCDAFEASGRRVALISYGECRVKEALLLRSYTADLTVLTLGREMHISPADEQTLHDSDIKVFHDPIVGLSRLNESIVTRLQHRDNPLLFDILYSALGTRIRSELATSLGADADADGALIVDRHQRTTIPGLYAAGDVVRGLSQINIAAAQAAIAATSINSELPHLRF